LDRESEDEVVLTDAYPDRIKGSSDQVSMSAANLDQKKAKALDQMDLPELARYLVSQLIAR